MAKFTDELVTRLSVVGAEAMATEFRKAGGSAKGFGKDLDGGLSKQMAMMNMAQGAGALGGQLSGLGDRALGTARGFLQSAAVYDTYERSLAALSGSSTVAKKQLADLLELAKMPALGPQEVIETFTGLTAASMSAEQAKDTILAFGNAAARAGKGPMEFGRAMIQLQQMYSQNILRTEDLRLIMAAIPETMKVMQARFNTTDLLKIRKDMSAREFIAGLTEGFLELDPAASGAANAMVNMQQDVDLLKAAIGTEYVDSVIWASERTTDLTEALRNADPALRKVVAWGTLGAGGIAKLGGGVLETAANIGQIAIALNGLKAARVAATIATNAQSAAEAKRLVKIPAEIIANKALAASQPGGLPVPGLPGLPRSATRTMMDKKLADLGNTSETIATRKMMERKLLQMGVKNGPLAAEMGYGTASAASVAAGRAAGAVAPGLMGVVGLTGALPIIGTVAAGLAAAGLVARDLVVVGGTMKDMWDTHKGNQNLAAMSKEAESKGLVRQGEGWITAGRAARQAAATRTANGEDINVRIRGGAGVSGRTIGDVIALVNG